MATRAAHRRLTKEFKNIQENPVPYIQAKPDESNILRWHYVITGPPDTPYFGGEYHGTLQFPADYPFQPPAIRMTTPSGRFSQNTRLCLSMSDYHPGTWNPTWSVSTILMGLLSFMVTNEQTAGAITTSEAQKKLLAKQSHLWNIQKNPAYKQHFPELMETNGSIVDDKTMVKQDKSGNEQQDQKQQHDKTPIKSEFDNEKSGISKNIATDIPEKEKSKNILFIYLCILAAGSALAVRFVKF